MWVSRRDRRCTHKELLTKQKWQRKTTTSQKRRRRQGIKSMLWKIQSLAPTSSRWMSNMKKLQTLRKQQNKRKLYGSNSYYALMFSLHFSCVFYAPGGGVWWILCSRILDHKKPPWTILKAKNKWLWMNHIAPGLSYQLQEKLHSRTTEQHNYRAFGLSQPSLLQ